MPLVSKFRKSIKKQKIETKDEKYIVKGDIRNLDILYQILASGKVKSFDIQTETEVERINFIYIQHGKYLKEPSSNVSAKYNRTPHEQIITA